MNQSDYLFLYFLCFADLYCLYCSPSVSLSMDLFLSLTLPELVFQAQSGKLSVRKGLVMSLT